MPHTITSTLDIDYAPSTRPTAEFCSRLIKFYKRHGEWRGHMSVIWSPLVDLVFPHIQSALEKEDRQKLADCLQDVCVQTAMWGVDLPTNRSPEGERALRGMWSDAIIDSAASLGVIPYFNPQQPNPKEYTHEGMIAAMEVVLGGKLHHRGCAMMAMIKAGDRRIPFKLAEAAQIAGMIQRMMTGLPKVMVEIGAGTAFIGYLMRSLAEQQKVPLTYHTVDLPVMGVLQGFLLAQAFGDDQIWFSGEEEKNRRNIQIHGLIKPELKLDCALNQNSFPELPAAEEEEDLKWIEKHLRAGGKFLSINHESDSGGQFRVFAAIQKCPSLRLTFRQAFIGRPGYLTEVYEKTT